MKKISVLFAFLLVAAVTFVGCKKDEEEPVAPTVTISQDKTEAWQGDTVTFTISASSDQDLNTLKISFDPYQADFDSTFAKGKHSVSVTYKYKVPGSAVNNTSHTLTVKVTDSESLSTSKTASISIKEPVTTTPLGAETAFTWSKCATTIAGFSAVGLTSTSNSASGPKIVKGTATKFVVLSAADWTSITTKEALQAKVDATAETTSYETIIFGSNKTYNEVIATINSGVYTIINITGSNSSTQSCGTEIIITGKTKN